MATIEPISHQIWDMKYRMKAPDGTPIDNSIDDTFRRVSDAVAKNEEAGVREKWSDQFFDAMSGFRFLPAGRILAGAGTDRLVTLFNCFVMGEIPDDMGGIFENLKEAALTMQQGGGIGYDFSTLRPKGAAVKRVGADASGPLPFMDAWDAMCRTIMSAGHRRGAMMATLRCDHPDIEDFIEAKKEPGRLRMFNLSVLVTDDFMDAVRHDAPWELKFDGRVFRTVPARSLWDRIMASTYAFAEPGVIFIDRINRRNNLNYCETIFSTNPCGEQPLPPYGACLLGSVNLVALVKDPFGEAPHIDASELADLVHTAVRMMDNVIDISNFPLSQQEHEAKAKRRIGLGITGLADALIMCGKRYGSKEGLKLTESWLKEIQREAYLASAALGSEKGVFPLYDRDQYIKGETIQALDKDVIAEIEQHGVRNALVTSIAPTGTISLFANNVSSGLEPVFSFSYTRKVTQPDGSITEEQISDYAYRLYKQKFGPDRPLPDYFVDAMSLAPEDHVAMQAAAQKYVDSSISKTINCPEELSFSAFKGIYLQAYDLDCKGLTTYRPNEITGSVLEAKPREENIDQGTLPFEEPNPRPSDMYEAGGIVYMTQPLDRPGALPGTTYKLRWPESDHAIYITLNDIIQDSRRRPFEIFINSKNTEHYAWTVAITRMISAVFRRGGDVSFVVEELKAVFDPRGGYWIEGKYVPSILAAIGGVIETHMKEIGFIPVSRDDEPAVLAEPIAAGETPQVSTSRGFEHPSVTGSTTAMKSCPQCYAPSLIRQEGCDLCLSCGYSKCS